MNRKLNMLRVFTRKAICISFTLLIALSFSAGSVMANSCQGGPDCLNCAAAAHPHIPGMDMEWINQSCQPAEQNRSCGFESGTGADDSGKMARIVNSGTHPFSVIFSIASDEYDQSQLYRDFLTQFQYPDRGELTPIYLLNLSLLC